MSFDIVETPEEAAARRAYEAEHKAAELVERLSRFANGMNHEQAEAFANALAREHPTLLGQIAKSIGIGVMRRVTRGEWKPYEPWTGPTCDLDMSRSHPTHDGRLDCSTVIGGLLMARQSFI